LQQSGNIGKLAAAASQSQLFTSLPAGSIGDGIRFDRQGRMYVADFKKHNVWVIERGETAPHVYFHSDRFNQPNDLAIAADGTLYANDPRFASPAGGQIWRITRGADGKGRGEVMPRRQQIARPAAGQGFRGFRGRRPGREPCLQMPRMC
jgi:sugar lactone lactonase YvrE